MQHNPCKSEISRCKLTHISRFYVRVHRQYAIISIGPAAFWTSMGHQRRRRGAWGRPRGLVRWFWFLFVGGWGGIYIYIYCAYVYTILRTTTNHFLLRGKLLSLFYNHYMISKTWQAKTQSAAASLRLSETKFMGGDGKQYTVGPQVRGWASGTRRGRYVYIYKHIDIHIIYYIYDYEVHCDQWIYGVVSLIQLDCPHTM